MGDRDVGRPQRWNTRASFTKKNESTSDSTSPAMSSSTVRAPETRPPGRSLGEPADPVAEVVAVVAHLAALQVERPSTSQSSTSLPASRERRTEVLELVDDRRNDGRDDAGDDPSAAKNTIAVASAVGTPCVRATAPAARARR